MSSWKSKEHIMKVKRAQRPSEITYRSNDVILFASLDFRIEYFSGLWRDKVESRKQVTENEFDWVDAIQAATRCTSNQALFNSTLV